VRRIPLVLVSALGDALLEAVDKESAKELHIARILPKPIHLAKLLDVAQEVARAKR
jgi:hypothetical protein